jgi:hypothetical protein
VIAINVNYLQEHPNTLAIGMHQLAQKYYVEKKISLAYQGADSITSAYHIIETNNLHVKKR